MAFLQNITLEVFSGAPATAAGCVARMGYHGNGVQEKGVRGIFRRQYL